MAGVTRFTLCRGTGLSPLTADKTMPVGRCLILPHTLSFVSVGVDIKIKGGRKRGVGGGGGGSWSEAESSGCVNRV